MITFQEKFNKTYDATEDLQRLEIFRHKLDEIHEHNEKFEKGLELYSLGLNQFSDWTYDELKNLHGLGNN